MASPLPPSPRTLVAELSQAPSLLALGESILRSTSSDAAQAQGSDNNGNASKADEAVIAFTDAAARVASLNAPAGSNEAEAQAPIDELHRRVAKLQAATEAKLKEMSAARELLQTESQSTLARELA